jgi:hypothetical protein
MHSWIANHNPLIDRDYYTGPDGQSKMEGDVQDIKVVVRTKRDAPETSQVVDPNFDEPPRSQIRTALLYVYALSPCSQSRIPCVPEALA